jgi:hypothetical protein
MDVADWLKGLGLERYAASFCENEIDGNMLASLTVDDLKELGIASFGHRKRLLEAIATLRSTVDKRVSAGAIGTLERRRRQLHEFLELVLFVLNAIGVMLSPAWGTDLPRCGYTLPSSVTTKE